MGVNFKVTGDSKLNDSPDNVIHAAVQVVQDTVESRLSQYQISMSCVLSQLQSTSNLIV